MATLDTLKKALKEEAAANNRSFSKQPLSESQYSEGFQFFISGSGWLTYQDFIIPQLSQLLTPLLNSRNFVSVLEIGPGPKSVLGHLPDHQKRQITRYVAFEPNSLLAAALEDWLGPDSSGSAASSTTSTPPLPGLHTPPIIHRLPFPLHEDSTPTSLLDNGLFEVILFCHSMYGLNPKEDYIKQALELLDDRGLIAVFHRDNDTLNLNGLIPHRAVCFPTGCVRVADEDKNLDCFAHFVAGYAGDTAVQDDWRNVCRSLGHRDKDGHLLFSAPDIMMSFNKYAATAVSSLGGEFRRSSMPVFTITRIKNRTARLHLPAAVVRPECIEDVRHCVSWALKLGFGLTVVGGSHSGHCTLPGVVAVDMSAFNSVHIIPAEEIVEYSSVCDGLVVAESGCTTGDIISKAMAAGLTVPLGSRPSVGAGLWLQGGIGHLTRLHGLACDAIVGAEVVRAGSSEVMHVGYVPRPHEGGAFRCPRIEKELLWAIKGAGTNFGIVVSVTLKAYRAPTYLTSNFVSPLSSSFHDAYLKLQAFDHRASELPRDCSTDAYLYWEEGNLRLGAALSVVTSKPSQTGELAMANLIAETKSAVGAPELEPIIKAVDGMALFETEMYMSAMHGGHAGGKTSAFKRCVFLKSIGLVEVVALLIKAVETRPSPRCYLHLLHGGGGAASEIPAAATAFGCRDWRFACVVTGVWPRDQDGTEASRAVVGWVYDVVRELLPLSAGVYGADLGPDPRDVALAGKAFGLNRPRLARLKRALDPNNVLAYTCPISATAMGAKLIILVTGDSGVGKDYTAKIWASAISVKCNARVVSISEALKREYADATGADITLLLSDRTYKEQHRPALTTFYKDRVEQEPHLPEEQFLSLVDQNLDVDVLVVTGMRDQAPVPTFSPLVPDSRVLEVRVSVNAETQRARRRGHVNDDGDSEHNVCQDRNSPYRPSYLFENEEHGAEAATAFLEKRLLPLLHDDIQRLANMVRSVPDFPRLHSCFFPGRIIEFRHILGIAQHPDGLTLCISLLESHFSGNWDKVDAVVSCEAGGFIFASALALRVALPLIPIREAGKLPPPTVSVCKYPSHISSPSESSMDNSAQEQTSIEIDRDAFGRNSSVVVVDDVLARGYTLCAVLKLLVKAGIKLENISVMVVAEFPLHGGRDMLHSCGFGGVSVQSLLVFGGF